MQQEFMVYNIKTSEANIFGTKADAEYNVEQLGVEQDTIIFPCLKVNEGAELEVTTSASGGNYYYAVSFVVEDLLVADLIDLDTPVKYVEL